MNERIRELAERSGIKLTPMIVDGVEYDYEDVEMDGSEDLQKFAELIVDECIAQCWSVSELEHNGYVVSECSKRVRKCFGLEV